MSESMLTPALEQAAFGFRVFPVKPGTKGGKGEHILKSWKDQATSDPAQIKNWWSKNKQANICIAPDKTFLVLDFDVKSHGAKSLRSLIASGLITQTYTVQTPTGGLHMYYKLPVPTTSIPYQQLINKVGWMGGVDIRAAGGYVVAPGSTRNDCHGRSYKIIKMGPATMATIPQVLLARLPVKGQASKPTSEIPTPPEYAQTGLGSDTASTGLITSEPASEFSSIPKLISAGTRNATLYSYASSWRERGIAKGLAQALMDALHKSLEQPPQASDEITIDEAQAILDRVFKQYKPGAEQRTAEQAVIDKIQPDQTSTTIAVVSASKGIPGKPEDVKAALTRFIYCVDGNQIIDTAKPPQIAAIPIASFNALYANVKFKKREGTNYHPLPKIWLEHKNRLSVDALGYRPRADSTYADNGSALYNTWRESPLAAAAEALEITATDVVDISETHCKPFFEHLDYLFGEDEKEKTLFWHWLAYSLRYPHKRIDYAVLIVGDVGLGKSWFHEFLKVMVGKSEVKAVTSSELTSEFNSWTAGCSFVFIHELLMSGKKAAMEQVKNMITENEVMINEKQVKRKMTDIYASYMAFSNHAHAASIAARDRKFFVYRSIAEKASREYFKKIFNWLRTEGPTYLLRHINDMDLSMYDPHEEPMETTAKRDMVHSNMSQVEQLMRDACTDKVYPFDVDIVGSTRVNEWVLATLGIEKLDTQDTHSVRTTLSDLMVVPLPQDRYSVPGIGQMRLKAIRNGKKWRTAGAQDVIEEYLAAAGYRLPTDKSLPRPQPHLERVK